MKAQPIFTPNSDGYDLSPTAVLIVIADTVFRNKCEMNHHVMSRCVALIESILAAAHVGGFKQTDILRTLLARNEHSSRLRDMAQSACDAAGYQALNDILVKFKQI